MTESKKYLTAEEMVSVKCDVEEQETCVSFIRDEKIIKWYTCDNTMITEFKRLVVESPDMYKAYVASYDSNGNPMGYFIEMPREFLSFRRRKRQLSEEQRQKASDRFKKYHNDRKNKQMSDM